MFKISVEIFSNFLNVEIFSNFLNTKFKILKFFFLLNTNKAIL